MTTPPPMNKNQPASLRQRINRWVNAGLIVICFFMLLPIATTLLISFKREEDVIRTPAVIFPCDTPTASFDLFACRWSIEGYERVFLPQPDPQALLGFKLTGRMLSTYLPNTLLYAGTTAVIVVLLSAMAGFTFARYKFRGRNMLLVIIIAITGFPLLTNLLALYQMGVNIRNSLPIYDERVYLIIVYSGFFLPLSIWISKGFFDAIPRELEEAAMVDGCSPAGAFWRITLNLVTPGMMAIFLLTFVGVWNEFLAGYLLISKNTLKPAMFGMYDFLGQNLVNSQLIAAACIIVAMPMVVVFLFARESFFSAMVEGAVKG